MKIDANFDFKINVKDNAFAAVTRNNQRIIDGSDIVITSPLLEDHDDSDIIERVEGILAKYDLTATLRSIEDDNRSKIGPRSIAKPWSERKPSLHDYFTIQPNPRPLNLSDYDDIPNRLRPLTPGVARDGLISSSSSGLPFMTRKGTLSDMAIDEVMSEVNLDMPCVLFTRTQEGGKTRNVWGFPYARTILEMTIFRPWFESFEKSLHWRSAVRGIDFVDQSISRALKDVSEDKVFVSIDFSGYDASIQPEWSAQVFDLIGSSYQRGFEEIFDDEIDYFTNCGIVTPDGVLYGSHGVPSGSGFTNTVDSFVQYGLYRTYPDTGRLVEVQGDDGVYHTPEPENLMENFTTSGLRVNEDKSHVSRDEVIYLQRYYSPTYARNGFIGGIYSIFRALNRIKYLERWTDFKEFGISGRDYHALRTIMILENCKYHPSFKEFVLLIAEMDDNKLRYDPSSISTYSRIVESKTRANVNHNVPISGLDGFRTVAVLRDLW